MIWNIRKQKTTIRTTIRKNNAALAGVAQWIECQLVNQRIFGSIPSLGHMPGLQVRYPVGTHER